jgi:hypothetical protein
VLDCFQWGRHVAGRAQFHVPVIEVIGSADEDDGILSRLVLGAVDVGLHAFAVAHGHHDLAFDDGDGFEFAFGCVAPGDGGGVRLAGLRKCERHDAREDVAT